LYYAAKSRLVACAKLLIAEGAAITDTTERETGTRSQILNEKLPKEDETAMDTLLIRNIPEVLLECLDNSMRVDGDHLEIDFR